MRRVVPDVPTSKTDEAEKEVLGILLFQPQQMPRAVEDGLAAGLFTGPHHEAICTALLALYQDGQVIHPESVFARMTAMGTAALLAPRDGVVYLVALQNECNRTDGLADYLLALKRATNERQQQRIREALTRAELPEEQREELGERIQTLQREHDRMLAGAAAWAGDSGPPVPFDLDEAPAWPADVLPEPLGSFVDAVATFQQVPRDLPGMLALGVLSSCAADKARAVPFEGHSEALSLYCVTVADVGERKSGTYSKFEAPILDYQAELRKEQAPLWADYAAEKAGLEAEIKRAIERRKNAEPDSDEHGDACDRARHLQAELAALRRPRSAEFLTQDCTPEGLARLMSETGGIVCLMSPEGGGVFDNMAGRYADVPNLDVFLKGYDGERLIIHRASRDREHPPIERPALVLNVTTQPDTLRSLMQRRELSDRGLVQRMIFAAPSKSLVGSRPAFMPPIAHGILDDYRAAVLRLLRLPCPESPHLIPFGSDAFAGYTTLHDAIEERVRPRGDLHPIRGWALKLVGKTVRIAALFHLLTQSAHSAEPWQAPVGADSFRRAARLVDYLIAHYRRAFGLMSQPPHIEGARKLLAALERDGLDVFPFRYAHRLIARNERKEAVRPALDWLAAHNYIAPTASRRSDSELWRVNPHLVREWHRAAPAAAPSRAGTVGTVSCTPSL